MAPRTIDALLPPGPLTSFEFETGRVYDFPQTLKIVLLPCGKKARFDDPSRHMSGMVAELPDHAIVAAERGLSDVVGRAVLSRYDRGDYGYE